MGPTPETCGELLRPLLVNTSQQFGSVLGLAVLVAVAAARTGDAARSGDTAGDAARAAAETAGFRAALLTGAALAALAALLSVRLHRSERAAAPGDRVPDPY